MAETKKSVKLTEANRVENQPVDIDVIPEPTHPTKSTKVANWLVAGALVVVAISIGIFLKWSFAGDEVLTIKNSPFPARIVPDPSGQTGGIVFLKAEYCKNSDLVGELRMSYVSKSREVFLPLTEERLKKGCEDREVPVVIPLNLLKDEYKVKFRVTYDINPLKRGITTNFESQPITVGSNEPR